MATGTLPDSDQDKIVSSRESDELFNDTYGSDVARGIAEAENYAATGGNDPEKPVEDQEKDPNAPEGGWHNGVVAGGNKGEKGTIFARIRKNKGWLAGIGIGGAGISIPLIILSLLPLKLEMMIQNVTGLASKVPEYAIQHRTEYIITRALAARMLGIANGTSEADSALVFCKGGGIACSLFSTYSTNYFQDKLGISIDGKAHGVTSLGGKAKSWTVNVSPSENVDGVVNKITIKSNGEMKKFIAAEVNKSHDSTIIERFLARKLLMKKFGVSNWRGPPIVENTINGAKTAVTNMKTSILKNTVGKIAPRATTYLTCLTGDQQLCDNLRESLSTGKTPTLTDPANDPKLAQDKSAGTQAYQDAVNKYNQAIKLQGAVADAGPLTADEAATGVLQKIITKRVLTAAGVGGAVLGVLDVGFSAIHSVADGTLSKIQYDIASQVYTGFSTDVATAWEKVKAGDSDINTLAAYSSMFDNNPSSNSTVSAANALNNGVDSSPLYQAESGQAVDTSKGITVPCDGPNGKVNTTLAPGQLICDDQKAVRDFAPYFQTDPTGVAIANISGLWVSSVHQVFKFAGDTMSAILSAVPGFNQAMSALGSVFSGSITSLVDWVMSLVFHTPNVGPSASGSDNYVGLSGGIRITQNALMEEGVAADGSAMGGGGTVLSNSQLAVIDQQQQQADKAYFNSQPLLARIFDTSLTGSFAQQFISRIPTSVSSMASLPISSFMQLFTGASAATASATANPFGLPMYGYSTDSAALTADPGVYTDASCAASAAAREASLYKGPNDLVATYHVADPCALEKMVVGSQLQSNGVTNDPYSLQPITGATSTNTSSASMQKPANTTPRGNGWTLSTGVDYTSTACDSRTKDIGTYKNPDTGITVRLCVITAFDSSSGQDINTGNANVVASVISANLMNMFTDAKTAGISLGVTDGMRSATNPDYKVTSQHAKGLAIDIGSPSGGQTICYKVDGWGTQAAAEQACAGNTVFAWLKANAAKYGFQNLVTEPWHWSMGE